MPESGDEARRLAETAQEVLVGVRDMAPDGGQLRTVGPDVFSGDHQAGVVDRLEGESDAPALRRLGRSAHLLRRASIGHARRVEQWLLAVALAVAVAVV